MNGHLVRLAGDPLQVAQWLLACLIAGIGIRMQIKESTTTKEGTTAGTQPAVVQPCPTDDPRLPVRKPGESWTKRLQWLLSTSVFGFCSPLTREQAGRSLV